MAFVMTPQPLRDQFKRPPLRDQFKRPLRDLRISVTDRCNFRCTYCMPAEIFGEKYQFLPKAQVLTFEEIARLTRIIVRLGAVKVRLTGGEPLVREINWKRWWPSSARLMVWMT